MAKKIQAVTALYERLGLKELARKAIEDYSERALALLRQVEMSHEARQAFENLITSLVNREK